MQTQTDEQIRRAVRQTYGQIANAEATGCDCDCGCDSEGSRTAEDVAVGLGYSKDEVSTVPQGANMGLGCGNPQAIASLRPGETVVDLGSGGGFDCFLAAKAVGPDGHVIGVDMTAEMIAKARENAAKSEFDNVEFRLGEIEALPVEDAWADVIISNCVINLSAEKPKVYKDAYRVLKPGGRLAIADIVATAELPEEIRNDLKLHAGCVAGASEMADVRAMLEEAGFTEIRITPLDKSKEIVRQWKPGAKVEDYVLSATIEAVKPN
jgi:SAM-dependent methyltransferase